MALLNRKVDYAILVLAELHRHTHGASARELAVHLGLSQSFLANILKELCHKGFVTSHRGVKGGYLISPGVQSVNLADFIESLDDSFRLAECNGTGPQDCVVFDRCLVRQPIAAIHSRIRNVLRDVLLAELFRPASVPAAGPLTVLGREPQPVAS